MSRSLNVSCALVSLRNLYSPAKIPSNPQNPVPASLLPWGLSQWEAISPISTFHGSLHLWFCQVSQLAVYLPTILTPQRPWASRGQELAFIFFTYPLPYLTQNRCLKVVELIALRRWIFEFSVPRPIIYTLYYSKKSVKLPDTLRKNKVTTKFLPKIYNLSLIMEKHQTNPTEESSIKPLVCTYQKCQCHERHKNADIELNSGSWENYGQEHLWDDPSMRMVPRQRYTP